jgi:cyclopropane fatty-acyl-phospholipid synthase-like methyltransferase
VTPNSPANSSQYENGDWLAKNPDWGESDAQWKARQVAKLLADNHLEPASVCDVGCGTGGVLDALHGLLPGDPRLVGYEISADGLSLASPERRQRVELVHGTVDDTDETYDIVLALDVFEHVTDYMGFLESLLPHGRRFVFHIPLDMNVKVVMMGTAMRLRDSLGHLHYFSRETALATLADTGYRVIEDRFTKPSLELIGREGVSKSLRWPRVIGMKISPVFTARLAGGFPLLVLAEPAD